MSISPPLAAGPDWSCFDPRDYLREYYSDLGPENIALLRFLAEVYREIPKGGRMLDFGGGPTIYQLISAAARVDEIHFTDFLDQNLEEVRRWRQADPAAFDWSPFIRVALEEERGQSCRSMDVEKRAQRIRECLTWIARCDASRTPPLESPRGLYEVLLSNFCAESATSDPIQWQAFMANITSLLKPGGWLVMAALMGATQYAVGSRVFPAVSIAPDDLIELLEEIGFPRKGVEVRIVPADRPTRDYAGLLLSLARKDPAGRRRQF